jgi:hypothetical protein
MPWHQALIRFQEIDLQLQAFNERMREIQAELADRSEVTAARAQVEATRAQAEKAAKAQKDREFELEQVQRERRLKENQLYSGTITNARELTDLQAKASSLKRRQATLEDVLLEEMIAREAADEAAATAQARLRAVDEARETRNRQLRAELQEIQERGEALMDEAQELKAVIPDAVLDAYHYLKDRTGNRPVAQLDGEICSVCGIEVLKTTQRKVKNGQEAYCDGCRRLLVA